MKMFLVGMATLLLVGCGGVLSKHPASEEANRGDDRLIGFWLVDWEASGGTKEDAENNPGLFAVGRGAAPEAGLELLTVSLEKGEVLKVERGPMRATMIGGRPYASLRSDTRGQDDQRQETWTIVRYDLPEDGVLRVLLMDEKAVSQDVTDGVITGTTTNADPNALVTSLTVSLSAPTATLRAYLEKRGEGAFKAAHPLVLRRITFR